MRRISPCLGLLVVLATAMWAWGQVPTRSWVLQNAATATGTGLVAHVGGYTLATVQVLLPAGATPSFTMQFEQSLNDIHYSATLCGPIGTASSTGSSTTNAAGMWRCNIAGALWFRTNITDYSGSGSVTSIAVATIGDVGTGFPPVITTTESGEVSNIVAHVSSTTHISGRVEQAGHWEVTVNHVTSRTHVAGAIMVQSQDRSQVATLSAGALNVSCTGCSASSTVSVSHISSVTHIAGNLALSGTLPVSQSGTWTVQATHQAGNWSLLHVSSVTHVSGQVQIRNAHSSQLMTVSTSGELLVNNSGTVAQVALAHMTASDADGNIINGLHLAGNVGDELNSALRVTPVTLVTVTGTIGHISSTTHVVASEYQPLHVVASTGSGNLVCHSTAAVHQTATSAIVAHGATGHRLFICSVLLVVQTAQNISIVEGTGSGCGTGTRGVIGGTSASMAIGANGGYSSISPFPQFATTTAGNQLCVLKSSSSGTVSGSITYRAAP